MNGMPITSDVIAESLTPQGEGFSPGITRTEPCLLQNIEMQVVPREGERFAIEKNGMMITSRVLQSFSVVKESTSINELGVETVTTKQYIHLVLDTQESFQDQ